MSEKLQEIVKNMSDPRLIMYVVTCHVDKPMEEAMPDSIYYVPIQAGAALTEKRVCEINDYDGFEDSISDRNQRYSEMTAMYFAGKHIETPYIGIIHYRRRFLLDDATLKKHLDEGFDIITTEEYPLPEIVNDNYRVAYYGADWDLLLEILERRNPEYMEIARKQFNRDHIHPCNMNIFRSEVYKEYCDFVFPILDEFYQRSPWKKDTYQRRDVGFIGERLSSLFVEKKRIEGAKVIDAPFRDLRSKGWTPEDECNLADFDRVYEACEKYYKQDNITRCRNLVAGALDNGGINDDRIRDLALLFKAALEEQRVLPQTIFEYLPDDWKNSLSTLRQMYSSLGGILKLASGGSEQAINMYREFIASTGLSNVFIGQLCRNLGMTDEKQIEAIVELSPVNDPIIVIEGNDICHGALQEMARSIGNAYEKLCEKVILIPSGDSEVLEETLLSRKNRVKFFIGAQALVLQNKYFQDMLDVPKIQLIVDNPAFLQNFYEGLNDSYYTFIQDYKYVSFVKKYYGFSNAFYMPVAGTQNEKTEAVQKKYELSFVGRYDKPTLAEAELEGLQKSFYEYMIHNPNNSYEEGLLAVLDGEGVDSTKENVPKLLWELRDICYQISYYYRDKVIQSILGGGIGIDVFGDTWKDYEGAGKELLRIHPEIQANEAPGIYNQSKLSLNIMSWHKAGITERVSNIMMSDAVCISEMTEAINKEFITEGDGQQIVTYKLDELWKLPDIIKELMGSVDKRKSIVENANAVCCEKHTWENRAIEIYQTLLEHI